jgi:hypothetical protein
MLSSLRPRFSSSFVPTLTAQQQVYQHVCQQVRRQHTARPRVVILGSGWSGHTLARRLCRKGLFDVRVISPSNHFLFTPLLPSTAVGTLEFRAIQVNFLFLEITGFE